MSLDTSKSSLNGRAAKATRTDYEYPLGELIFAAGDNGQAWRIRHGAVRLDRLLGSERIFAGLALEGDILGADTLLYGVYSFDARALSDVTLEPWLQHNQAPTGESLLKTLAATERRAAEALSLRGGEALDRVRQLMLLLAHGRQQIVIPGLKDMAEITGLTIETVSRAMSRLSKSGLLKRQGRRLGLIFAEQASPLAV